jgi:hypothetical protein
VIAAPWFPAPERDEVALAKRQIDTIRDRRNFRPRAANAGWKQDGNYSIMGMSRAV